MSDKNKPAEVIRDGTIKATIWRNETANRESGEVSYFYSVDVVRGYQDTKGDWKETTSMSSGEILRAANLLQLSYNHILALKEQDKAQGKTEAEAVG